MALPAFITNIGAPNANSYRTLDEAGEYFEARLDSENWFAESPTRQTQLLLKAAKRLDQINWLGARVDAVQALAWPRIGVAKRDGAGVAMYAWVGSWPAGYGEQYRTDEIPVVVKDAQCEFAFEFLNGWTDDGEAEIKSFSADGMSATLDQPKLAGALPAEVARLIAGLISPHKRIRG
jgi:hypothetical protein